MSKILRNVFIVVVIIICVIFVFILNNYSKNNSGSSILLSYAESVPGVKLDMKTLSTDQMSIIDMVNKNSAQRGGSQARGKIVTGMWEIFNEKNHYKLLLTAPQINIFLDQSPIYYDVYNGEIIGHIGNGVSSIIGENIFTSRAQNKFINDCYVSINNGFKKNYLGQMGIGEKNIVNDKTINFTYKESTECTCLGIGCCDSFKSITTEYTFVCNLNQDNSVSVNSLPTKNY